MSKFVWLLAVIASKSILLVSTQSLCPAGIGCNSGRRKPSGCFQVILRDKTYSLITPGPIKQLPNPLAGIQRSVYDPWAALEISQRQRFRLRLQVFARLKTPQAP